MSAIVEWVKAHTHPTPVVQIADPNERPATEEERREVAEALLENVRFDRELHS